MPGRVVGKVALVTGASLGIGSASARLLASEGAAVAVTDIKEAEGEHLAREIRSSGGHALFWKLDTSDELEVARVCQEISDTLGPIGILVNNAGIGGSSKPTHELTEAEWDHVQAVNVKGVFFCTKHCVTQMISAGGGSIINMSSIYGLVGAPDAPPYHASKGAVTLMTKTDALLYASAGIRVNSIHPGFISTPMVEEFLATSADPDAGRAALESLHPLGRLGDSDDVAFGVLYLASEESKFVTGSELVIDGGYTCR